MRILAYLYYPFFNQHLAGGVQVTVQTLVRGFLERGHQVRALCPGNDSRPLFEAPGLEVRPVLIEQRERTIASEDVSHNLREISRASEAVDVVWTVDRLFPVETPQPIVLSLSALCYANDLAALLGMNWDHLVVPSPAVARIIDSWFGRDSARSNSRRWSSIPPPLDPIFYPRRDVSRLYSKLGLNRDCRYLLFPHRPESGKGHELALRVLGELLPHEPRFHLLVPKPPISLRVDTRPEADWIQHVQSEATRLGLRDHVIFHDWIDYPDLPEYYSLGECCLHLSRLPETFGLSVVESIASGTFVVSSGTGAVSETVPPGEAHRVVPDLEPSAIASAVLAGCSEGGLQQARDWVAEKYSPQPIIDAYLECFATTTKMTAPFRG
ncbi:MAG TPA: glycosyltransferase family 4 protein [Terriglobia bacterium]|nr:glycosyltransferase family 4 protein [Terriglobia bacterium]